MSRLKDCVVNGEVKKVVNCFVDDYETMFDCFVTDISIGAVGDDDIRIDIILRRGEE